MTTDNNNRLVTVAPEQDLVKKQLGEKSVELVIQQVHILSVDRTMKDIASWRNALIVAENIYFPNRTRLLDLYKDVTLDGHLTGIMNKRMDFVLNKSLEFFKNEQEVEEMETFIHSRIFREIKQKILETIFWGLSGLEFLPGKEIVFEEIPRKHIKPEFGIISYDQNNYTGIDYLALDNVLVTGKKRELGLLLQCSPYAIYKKGDFADWAQYVEIFGQPMRVFKYDANDIKTKEQLDYIAQNSAGSAALVAPKQADIETIDGKMSNGDGKLQQSLKDACNDEMSILVLGNTETTNSTNGGSNAKSQVHSSQQDQIIKSDMDFLLGYLNSPKFLAILKSYGLPVDGGSFKFKKEIDLQALSQKITIDTQVAKQVPIGADYWYKTYAIPKPDNFDELMKKKEAAETAEETPDNDAEDDATKKETKPATVKKTKPKNLSFFDRLKAELSDFFDQAHKD